MAHVPAFRRLSALGLTACLAVAPVAAPATAKAADACPVYAWKIVAPGAAEGDVDYVVGTLYPPPPTLREIPAELRALVAAASTLVMQVPDEQVDVEKLLLFAKMPTDRPLSAYMKPAQWQKAVGIGKRWDIPPAVLAGLAPWFVSMLVLDTPGAQPVPTLDERLRAHALSRKVPLTYLESAEDEFRLRAEVSLREQVARLLELLDTPEREQAAIAAEQQAYDSGDLATVERVFLDPAELKRYPDLYEKTAFGRAARWLPRIEQVCKDEDAVIAVQFEFLLGRRGLLKALRDRGYHVQPLTL